MIFTLQSHEIDANWSLFAHHLETVCDAFREDIRIDEIREDLKAARKQLWGCHDGESVIGVVVTEIQPPVCWLRVASGKLTDPQQIEETLSVIETWARSIHCDRIKLAGRNGWKRRLPQYRQTGVILEKRL